MGLLTPSYTVTVQTIIIELTEDKMECKRLWETSIANSALSPQALQLLPPPTPVHLEKGQAQRVQRHLD